MQLPNLEERIHQLIRRAGEKFGPDRAEELRPQIEQMADELHTLQLYELEFEDEP